MERPVSATQIKNATTVDQQIALLRSRGMLLDDALPGNGLRTFTTII